MPPSPLPRKRRPFVMPADLSVAEQYPAPTPSPTPAPSWWDRTFGGGSVVDTTLDTTERAQALAKKAQVADEVLGKSDYELMSDSEYGALRRQGLSESEAKQRIAEKKQAKVADVSDRGFVARSKDVAAQTIRGAAGNVKGMIEPFIDPAFRYDEVSPKDTIGDAARRAVRDVSGLGIASVVGSRLRDALEGVTKTADSWISPELRASEQAFAERHRGIDRAPTPEIDARDAEALRLMGAYDPALRGKTDEELAKAREHAALTVEQAWQDPAGVIAEGAGNVAPLLVGGRLAGAAKIPANVVADTMGILGGVGAVKGGIRDKIMDAEIEVLRGDPVFVEESAKIGPDAARVNMAERLSSYGENPGLAIFGALEGLASARLGADASIARAGAGKSAARAMERKAVREMAGRNILGQIGKGIVKESGSESIQEGAENIASNIGAASSGAKIDPMEGVVQAAVRAGLTSAVPGGAATGTETINARRALADGEPGGTVEAALERVRQDAALAKVRADVEAAGGTPPPPPGAAPVPPGGNFREALAAAAPGGIPRPRDPLTGLPAKTDLEEQEQAQRVMQGVDATAMHADPDAEALAAQTAQRRDLEAQQAFQAAQAQMFDRPPGEISEPLPDLPTQRSVVERSLEQGLLTPSQRQAASEAEAEAAARLEDRDTPEAQAAREAIMAPEKPAQPGGPIITGEEPKADRTEFQSLKSRVADDEAMAPVLQQAIRQTAEREQVGALGGPMFKAKALLAEPDGPKKVVDALMASGMTRSQAIKQKDALVSGVAEERAPYGQPAEHPPVTLSGRNFTVTPIEVEGKKAFVLKGKNRGEYAAVENTPGGELSIFSIGKHGNVNPLAPGRNPFPGASLRVQDGNLTVDAKHAARPPAKLKQPGATPENLVPYSLEQSTKIRFKNPSEQKMFDALLDAAENPESELYYQGQRHRGAMHRSAFWDGVDGIRTANVVPKTLSEVAWKAGREFAKRQAKAATDGTVRETAAKYGEKPTLAVQKGPEGVGRVSPRKPSSVGGQEHEPTGETKEINTAAVYASKKHLERVATAVQQYNTVFGENPADWTDPVKTVLRFKQIVVDNLIKLHNMMPAELRRRAQLWYEGANRIANDWSTKYDITSAQAAAVMAIHSPQKEWFSNVSLAERTIRIIRDRGDFKWSKDMTAWVRSYIESASDRAVRDSRRPLLEIAERLEGTPLNEMTQSDAARFVRVFDETYHDKGFRVVTPEGGFGDFSVNDDGVTKTPVAWPGYDTIEKAISVLVDGSQKNISAAVGNEHKVRSFFNSIIDPKSHKGDVVIDTHAVAAALLKALSGNSLEVMHNFGSTIPGFPGAGGSNVTGASGTYGLLADAYREAAARLRIRPNQLQSITWEAIRSVFPDSTKSQISKLVEPVWDRAKSGEITRAEAERQVLEISGGMKSTPWAGTPDGIGADKIESFNTELLEPQLREAVAEKARIRVNLSANTGQIEQFSKLRDAADAGDAAAGTKLSSIAEFGLKQILKGTSARVKPQYATGLYGGYVEPSVSAVVEFDADEMPEIVARLKTFAETFKQEQVHVLQSIYTPRGTKPVEAGHQWEDGSYATHAYTWNLKRALSRSEIESVIKESGLAGLTFGDSVVTAYFVEFPGESIETQLHDFESKAALANRTLQGLSTEVESDVRRLWPYGQGEGAIGWPGAAERSGVLPGKREEVLASSVRTADRFLKQAEKKAAAEPRVAEEKQPYGSDVARREEHVFIPKDRPSVSTHGDELQGYTYAIRTPFLKEGQSTPDGNVYNDLGLAAQDGEQLGFETKAEAEAAMRELFPEYFKDEKGKVVPFAREGQAAYAYLPDGTEYERPNSVAEGRADSDAAVRSLQALPGEDRKLAGHSPNLGSGATLLGAAVRVTEELKNRKRVDLRGQRVRTAKDLAVLARVYRDPRFETFRIFYVNRLGKILAHEAVTSRMVGEVTVFSDNPAKDIFVMQQRMKRLGASGYYLLHNHPTGTPTPSNADVRLTAAYGRRVPGFKGHVVLDGDSYGKIAYQNGRGYVDTVHQFVHGEVDPDPFLIPMNQRAVSHPAELVQMWNSWRKQAPEKSVFIALLDSRLLTRALVSVPTNLFLNREEFGKWIRGQKLAFGAQSAVAVIPSSLTSGATSAVPAAAHAYEDGHLIDFMVDGSNTTFQESGALQHLKVKERTDGKIIKVAEEKKPAPPKGGFYSALERAAQQMRQPMKGADALRFLSSREGVKKAEIEATKLGEFLEGKAKVTPVEVQEFLKSAAVKVETVERGDSNAPPEDYAEAREKAEIAQSEYAAAHEKASSDVRRAAVQLRNGQAFDEFSSEVIEEATELARLRRVRDESDRLYERVANRGSSRSRTKFAQYQTPGGTNYREVLLTLPVKAPATIDKVVGTFATREAADDAAKKLRSHREAGTVPAEYSIWPNGDQFDVVQQREAAVDTNSFRSSHFDEPNIVAHVRMNDRVAGPPFKVTVAEKGRLAGKGNTGKSTKTFPTMAEAEKFADFKRSSGYEVDIAPQGKVLFVEEIQSDWAQKGRREGFNKPQAPFVDIVRAPNGNWNVRVNGQVMYEGRSNVDAQAAAERFRKNPQIAKMGAAVPTAPFVEKTEDWTALAMKQILQKAAAEGYDSVAWTTGEMQAERYDLSKQISKVTWWFNSSHKGGAWNPEVGVLKAFDHNGREVIDQHIKPDQVADYIGKDVATKLLESKPVQRSAQGDTYDERSLSGLDLKVGGEGMKAFYDKIVPQVAEKIGKKWGAKVGTLELGAPRSVVFKNNRGEWWIRDHDSAVGDDEGGPYDTKEDAEAALEESRANAIRVHSIQLTDAMKRDIQDEGFALFEEKKPYGDPHISTSVSEERAPYGVPREHKKASPEQKKAPAIPAGMGRPVNVTPMAVDDIAARVAAASKGEGTPDGTPISELAPPEFHRNMARVLQVLEKPQAERLARIYDVFDKEMDTARGRLSWEQGDKEALKLLGVHTREQFLQMAQRGVIFNEPGLRAATRVMYEVEAENREALRALEEAKSKGGGGVDSKEFQDYVASSTDLAAWIMALRGEQAEAARAFGARKDLKGARNPLEKLIGALGRSKKATVGGSGLTNEQVAQVIQIAQEDPGKLPDLIRQIQRPTFWDMINEWRKGAMLFGVRTYGVNFFGNAFKQAVTLAEIPGAAAADYLKTPKGQERQVYLGELAAARAGIADFGAAAWTQLVKDSKKALQGIEEFDPESNKYEIRVGAIPGPLGKFIRTPFRMLTAADNFFKNLARGQSLYREAYRRARNEGLTGENAARRADELINIGKGSDWQDRRVAGMLEKANRAAEYETFTMHANYDNAGVFGAIAEGVARLEKAVPPIGLFAPFKATPANIAFQGYERSPLAWASVKNRASELADLERELKQSTRPAEKARIQGEINQKRLDFANQVSRAVIGTAIFTVAAAMAAMGLLTGTGPSDWDKNRVWKKAGNVPNAIRVGESDWYAYDRFEPMATTVSMAASVPEMLKEKSAIEVAARMVDALHDAFVAKTYLQGMEQMGQILSNTKAFGAKWLRDLEGSFVPAILAHTAEALDPTVRDNKRGLLDPIKARLPGMTQGLRQVSTGTGEPAEKTERLGGTALAPINPLGFIRTGSAKGDPLYKQFLEADYAPDEHKTFISIGVGPVGAKKQERVELTPAEMERFRRADEVATRILRNRINDPAFQRLDPDQKKANFRREYDRASDAVKKSIMPAAWARLQKQLAERRK